VVKSDGWKVDDMVFTGVEGVSLPGPVSLVDEYRHAITPVATAPSPGTAQPGTPPKLPPNYPPKYTPTPGVPVRKKHPFEQLFCDIRDAVGWGGIVAIAVLVVVGLTIYHSPRKKAPPP
jgi:hypothetical protein